MTALGACGESKEEVEAEVVAREDFGLSGIRACDWLYLFAYHLESDYI